MRVRALTGAALAAVLARASTAKTPAALGRPNVTPVPCPTQTWHRIAGHCGFSQPEMIKSFDDLTAWVNKGTKPAGDEVGGDLSNAGMTFTNPLRPYDPGSIRVTPGAKP